MAFTRSSLLVTLAAASSALVSTAHGFAIPRSAYEARQISDASELLPAYDYVIVGGGTSGLTVADRLTEDPATTVLVLEAGIFAPRPTFCPSPAAAPTASRASPSGRRPRRPWAARPSAFSSARWSAEARASTP